MVNPDNDSLQSSLPSSLIPHLYTAPQQPQDSSTRTTLAPALSLSPTLPENDQRSNPDPGYIPTSSFPLTPFVPPAPHNFENRFQGRATSLYNPELGQLLDRRASASLLDLAGTAVHQSTIPHISGQRFASPIYSDPVFHTSRLSVPSRTPNYPIPSPAPRDAMLQRTSWLEGEAGPSSLLPSIQRDEGITRGRRGSSQPARMASPHHTYGRSSSGYEGAFGGEMNRRDNEGDAYLSISGGPARLMGYSSQPSNSFHQGLLAPQFLRPSSGSEDPFRGNAAYAYPALDAFSLPSGSASTNLRGASPELHPSYHSDSRFSTPSGYHGDEYGGNQTTSQKGKKRRDSIDSTDDNPRKSRSIRKTAVACNFCRGRKLRCNGVKPSCYNCTVRKFDCEYVQVQRRRGPGKAPKGARTKKRTPALITPQRELEVATNTVGLQAPNDQAPSQVAYELDALAPELRPYTSVMTLDKFSFEAPDSSPPYPSLFIPRQQESRARTPRSRETSSEDRSDADDLNKKMGQ